VFTAYLISKPLRKQIMEVYSPRIRSLLRQAQRISQSNKRAAAINLYRQILEEAPEAVDAWVGLGQLLNDVAEKEQAYRQALVLDPGNEAALKGMAALSGGPRFGPDVTADDAAGYATEAGLPPDSEGQEVQWPEAPVWPEALHRRQVEPSSQVKPQQVERKAPDSTSGLAAGPVASFSAEAVAAERGSVAVDAAEELVCANHPQRKTSLRCNNCSRPICMACANPTPVGYRCPQCIREREDVFYNATPLDYVVAAFSALIISSFAALIVPRLGFFVIFLAAIAGSFIGRLVFRLAGRRRGRWLPHLVAAMIVVGALPAFLIYGGGWIWVALYLFLATGAAYYQMK
jgi:hypothetical protein